MVDNPAVKATTVQKTRVAIPEAVILAYLQTAGFAKFGPNPRIVFASKSWAGTAATDGVVDLVIEHDQVNPSAKGVG